MTRTGHVGADPLRTDRDCPEVKGHRSFLLPPALCQVPPNVRAP